MSAVWCLLSGSNRTGLRCMGFLSEVDHFNNINQDHILSAPSNGVYLPQPVGPMFCASVVHGDFVLC